jgi:hypothetical protein
MKPYIRVEYVPGIGRIVNENGKRRPLALTEAVAIVAEEPCRGIGGEACQCTSCAARRSIAHGMRNVG